MLRQIYAEAYGNFVGVDELSSYYIAMLMRINCLWLLKFNLLSKPLVRHAP